MELSTAFLVGPGTAGAELLSNFARIALCAFARIAASCALFVVAFAFFVAASARSSASQNDGSSYEKNNFFHGVMNYYLVVLSNKPQR